MNEPLAVFEAIDIERLQELSVSELDDALIVAAVGDPKTWKRGDVPAIIAEIIRRLQPNLPIDIGNFRNADPLPPAENTPQDVIDKLLRSIYIRQGGVTETLDFHKAGGSTGTWVEGDDPSNPYLTTEDQLEHFLAPQHTMLPLSALEEDDFYYLIGRNQWIEAVMQSGALVQRVVPITDVLGPQAIWWGAFAGAQAAIDAIGRAGNYNPANQHYAYFDGDIQRLTAFTQGSAFVSQWIKSNAELHSEIARLTFYIDNHITGLRHERQGVELLIGNDQRVDNLNQLDPNVSAQAARQTPTFSPVDLRGNSQFDADVRYLGRYDHLRLTLHLVNASRVTQLKTTVTFAVNDWLDLVGRPQPAQGSLQNARVADGSAMTWFWEDNQGNDRTIYIGRTNESNPRLLYAIRGYQGLVNLEVRGYRGLI